MSYAEDFLYSLFQNTDSSSSPSSTFSLEARNATLDRFLRINTSSIFVAEKSVIQPVVVVSLCETPEMSKQLFHSLKTKQSKLLVNRMNAYYFPRVLRERLPAKTLILNLQKEYREAMQQKNTYGITQLVNNPKLLRENSVLHDLSYLTQAIRKETIDRGKKMNVRMRESLLEIYKRHILEVKGPKYVDRIVYVKTPIFADTTIKLVMMESQLLNIFRPCLLFLEWLQKDPEGFKEWCIGHRVHFVFEGVRGQLFVLSGTERFVQLPLYKPRNIFRFLHIIDGKTEEDVTTMVEEEGIPVEELAPIQTDEELLDDPNIPLQLQKDKEENLIDPEYEETEEVVEEPEQDETSASNSEEEEEDSFDDFTDISYIEEDDPIEEKRSQILQRNKKILQDVDEIVDTVIQTAPDEEVARKKANQFYQILSDTSMSNEEKSVELLETHNYTNLRDSVETPEIRKMKTKLRSSYGKPIEDVVQDLKRHKLEIKEFPNIDPSSSYSKSTVDNLAESYNTKLKAIDRENILTTPMELSYPILLKGYQEKDISDREFKGTQVSIHYETHNGDPLDIELEIPESKNGKLFLGGSYKKLNLQDAAKPVIKTDEDVIITTAYNKCILNLKGRYPSTKAKIQIATLRKMSKTTPILKVKTTDQLGAFIYNNYVSYNMIHLNRHFNGMIADGLNLDFRGFHKDDKNPEWTYLGEFQDKPVLHHPEKDVITWNGETTPSLDFVISVAKFLEPELYKASEVRSVTIAQVNAAHVRIMAKDLPVILVLLIACPLKKLLERCVKETGLEYKIISNTIVDQKRLKSNEEYGIVRLAKYSILLKYNNALNEILWLPLTTMEFLEKYDTFDITNIMEEYVGNSNTSLYIENFKECFLDPITARVCDMYNIPSDFVGIFIYACSLFTNHKTTYKSDARNYRVITTEETINRCLYDVLAKAFSDNAARVKRGSRPKITIPKDAVIRRLQELPNLAESNPLSPFREIQDSRKKSMKGHYGLNNDRAYNAQARFFNEHSKGTETIATPYSKNAGVIKNLPFNPTINSVTGEYQPVESMDQLNPSNYLSFSESYVAYSSHGHVNRQMMTSGQFDHIRQVENADPLLISSHVDEAAVYISPTFSYVAKGKGKIEEINDQFVKIKYDNGEIEAISLENINKNSDKGYYITNNFVVNDSMKVGKTIRKNDVIAYNKHFFKKKANGALALAQGKLAMVYVCDDENAWEDSCLPFSDLSDHLANRVVKRIARVVDLNTEIRDPYLQIGTTVSPNDILFRYKSLTDDDSINAMIQGSEDLTLRDVEAHYRGKLLDIKVFYRTSPNIPMSPSIKKFIRDLGDVQRVQRHMGSISDVTDTFEKAQISSMPQVLTRGKMSKINGDIIENGQILIEYYIEVLDKLGPGDKIVLHSALKAEPAAILDKSLRPEGIESGRKASLIFSTYSQLARMVDDIFLTGVYHSILFHIAIKNMRALGIEPPEDDILHYRSSYNQSKKEWK